MRKLLLKITGIVTGSAMLLGAGYLVHAKNNKEVINTKVENLVDPIVKPVLAEYAHWFELKPTNEDQPSNQELNSPTPILPPDEDNINDCAQSENEGDYCAVALLFSITDPDLTGYTTVQDVLDFHPNCLGIAIDDEDIDADEDGYSRMPL